MSIPYKIGKRFGSFAFNELLRHSKDVYREVFESERLHRFKTDMADIFYAAVQKIHRDYNDDASAIWQGDLKSGIIIRRFLDFEGVGVMIAAIATNILVCDFKVPT